MQGRLVARGEDPGALEGDVDIGPGECCGVTFSGYPDRAATHINSVAGDRNLALETPMNAVIAHQMSIGLDRAKVVQRDNFDVVPTAFAQGAQHVAADPAKPIDRNFNAHRKLLAQFGIFDSTGAVTANKQTTSNVSSKGTVKG